MESLGFDRIFDVMIFGHSVTGGLIVTVSDHAGRRVTVSRWGVDEWSRHPQQGAEIIVLRGGGGGQGTKPDSHKVWFCAIVIHMGI
jgi:hypothetical protein